MENDQYPENTLFCSQNDYHNNACINWAFDTLDLYITGYKDAAELLIVSALERQKPIDCLVYPIVFLYRHYLELRLKDLIIAANQLLNEVNDYPKHHNIMALWKETKTLLKRTVDKEAPECGLIIIDNVINEFSRVDPLSFSFRYHQDKNGNNPLDGITHINIRHFAERMQEITKLLDGISMTLDYYLDQQNEMRNCY